MDSYSRASRPVETRVMVDNAIEVRSSTADVFFIGTGPMLPAEVVVLPDGTERVTAEREVVARASTRTVATKKPAWASELHWPEHGWTPLLVAARLKLAVETFRGLSEPGIRPRGHVSCMPEPVRQIFLDAAPDAPMPQPDKDAISAADATWEWVWCDLEPTDAMIAIGVGLGRSSRNIASWLRRRPDCKRMSHVAVNNRMPKLLALLARWWTEKGRHVDDEARDRAEKMERLWVYAGDPGR